MILVNIGVCISHEPTSFVQICIFFLFIINRLMLFTLDALKLLCKSFRDYGITSQRSPMYGEGSNQKVQTVEFTIEKSMIDSMSNDNVSVPEQL